MQRNDISSFLIHFTSGQSDDDALQRLQTILKARHLIPGSGQWIKGNHSVICFTEAPLSALANGLVNNRASNRYRMFGVLVSKAWLFSRGGRPVIYEPDEEYRQLNPTHAWRHVHYELREGMTRRDYTWEREWRIQCDSLCFDEQCAHIIVPDRAYADLLVRGHETEQDYVVQQYETIFDDGSAELYREQFRWRILTLR